MATPFPTGPGLWPESVEIERRAAQRVTRDPFTLGSVVVDDDADARALRVVIRMGELPEDLAAVMIAFLEGLDGMIGTFTFDVDPWWRGDTPAPGVREFRLEAGQGDWICDRKALWTVGIAALEVVENSS